MCVRESKITEALREACFQSIAGMVGREGGKTSEAQAARPTWGGKLSIQRFCRCKKELGRREQLLTEA